MKTLSNLTAFALTASLCACASTQTDTVASQTPETNSAAADESSSKAPSAEQSIVDIAVGNEDFSTLVAALQAAGLVETLSGEGPFTVFAPTNAAFAKLPEGALDGLLADPEQLAAVLTYHVVSGKVMAADVVNLTEATTLAGVMIAVDASNGVMINNATVVSADIEASNGVIHVIDTVLLPPG